MGNFGAFEATPGVIPELLRLTVSLWTLPSPGWSLEAFFWKLRFSSVFPGPCDKAHGMAATTPPVRAAEWPRGKTIFLALHPYPG